MARRWAWGLSAAAVLLGVGHLSLAALMFERLSLDALWFAGSGLAIVLGGMINMFAQFAHYGTGGRTVLGIANLVTMAFFALALTIVPEPQVVVGLILFGALAGLAWAGPTRTA